MKLVKQPCIALLSPRNLVIHTFTDMQQFIEYLDRFKPLVSAEETWETLQNDGYNCIECELYIDPTKLNKPADFDKTIESALESRNKHYDP